MSLLGENLAKLRQGILFSFMWMAPGLLHTQGWERMENFPGAGRDDGICFRIEGSAHCGTGLKVGWTPSRNFFAYDLKKGSWKGAKALPKDEERQYASGFSHDGLGYVFGGSRNGSFLKDLWRYDPERASWKAMTPLPAKGRSGTASFCIGDKAYIIGGKTEDKAALREVWAYDMSTNEWEEKGKLPFGGRWRASAAAVDGRGYLLFGADKDGNKHRQVYAYHPEQDRWKKVSTFPGKGRSYSRSEAVRGKLMIIAGSEGSNGFLNDTWRFNPRTEEWEELKGLPIAGRRGGMSFSDCSTLYYSTGLDTNKNRTRGTWKYPVIHKEKRIPNKIRCYPNPVEKRFIVIVGKGLLSDRGELTLFEPSGSLIHQSKIECVRTELDLSGLANGVYLLRYKAGGSIARKKILKVGGGR